jgi:5-methylcytosine-specific restriction endonuclease McrA
MPTKKPGGISARVDQLVAAARRDREIREKSYRARALKLLPWICTRCAREFTLSNVQLLTVHHIDGDHHHNPPDGSNWELLCTYCHENEHARVLDSAGRTEVEEDAATATYKPFGDLASMLKGKK